MDMILQKEVFNALRSNPWLFGAMLRLETKSGNVILYGTVPSWYQKQMIQETVRGINGVHEIRNEVQVFPQ